MPCFLAGASQGQNLSYTLRVPFFAHSHQQGHLAAAAWSAGRLDLLDRPFLAWHLSGGTTELLKVEPDGWTVQEEIVGGTSDISAGQLIDRAGVKMGLQFPAGKALDALYPESDEAVETLPAMQETGVRSLSREHPLQEEMATHSSILAWSILWTEEPGGLQSMGSQRVEHN